MNKRIDCKCDPCACGKVDVEDSCGQCPKVNTGQCPCPPECRDKMKKMKRYLNDTHFFLSKCKKCPLAEQMVLTAEELLADFKCPISE